MCAERVEKTPKKGVVDLKEEYISNAAQLITKALVLFDSHPNLGTLFAEMLHGIFFLGYYSRFQATPKETLGEYWYPKLMKKGFGKALTKYHNRLPRRSPFSCLLDMIVRIEGKDNPVRVRVELKNFISTLNEEGSQTLTGSTICITSDLNTKEVLTFGASLSQTGKRRNKRIILAVSCLHTLHRLVSFAVMCKTQEVAIVEDYRIDLRRISARCIAYNVEDLENEKSPCDFCQEMFSLVGPIRGPRYLPGNCAETEAISKLLKDRDINFDHNLDFRMKFDWLKQETNNKLKEMLKDRKFENFEKNVGVNILFCDK